MTTQSNRDRPRRCCVVIPTYNEVATIGTVINRLLRDVAPRIDRALYVLVVDGQSTDGTAATLRKYVAREPNLLVLTVPKAGIGDAYARGFQYALESLSPEIIVQMDGDLQHDPGALPGLIAACPPGRGVSIGSRFAPGARTPGLSSQRRAMSRAASWLTHHALAVPRLYDYTSGFRCISAAALETIDYANGMPSGYAFQTCLLVALLRAGCSAVEVPIEFGRRIAGRSKLTAGDLALYLSTLWSLRTSPRLPPLPVATERGRAARSGGQQ